MLIPAHFTNAASDVLLDTQAKVITAFNLQLRIGIVPMQMLQTQGYQLRVSKLRLSPQYTQAIFDGEGLEVAESWVKSPASDNPFLVVSEHEPLGTADFTGFTCRWQDVPSEKGEIVSLIIKLRSHELQARKKELVSFLTFLTQHYGQESDYHPICAKQMQAGGIDLLQREIKIHTVGLSWATRFWRAVKISFEVGLIRTVQYLHIPMHIAWVNVLEIKKHNVVSSDFRKFDGALKMVISGTTSNRNELMNYLESAYQQGRLFYGLHVSNRALLTCVMHIDSGCEVHFVDGADGGYTMAAKQLKAQLSAEK
jgi:hypothetical protein